MENPDEAEDAYDSVEGKRLEGRALSLEWARDAGGASRNGIVLVSAAEQDPIHFGLPDPIHDTDPDSK